MKPSKYNVILSEGSKVLFFNALTRNYFRVSENKKDLVKNVLSNVDIYSNQIPQFCRSIKDQGFVVEDELDELEIISRKFQENIDKKAYKLVLLPTLECNFRCWYCVQDHDHISGCMNQDVQDRICRHIDFMITKKHIESLNIDWFGGEPFKYFNEVMIPISNYAKEICRKHNIPFISTTTTNGYLISPEIIDKAKDLNFKVFHITLDGDRNYHNNIRQAKGESSFDVILDNINNLCFSIANVEILMRVNYDDHNLNPIDIIEQIDGKILPENKSKIKIYFRKVWQISHFADEQNKLNEARNLLINKGYQSPSDLLLNFIPCYANKKYYNAISYNGKVFKCTAKADMKDDYLGRLTSNGNIVWNKTDFDISYYTPLFKNEKCGKCAYLPICMGPCNKNFEKNNLVVPEFSCKLKKISNFKDLIIAYCK